MSITVMSFCSETRLSATLSPTRPAPKMMMFMLGGSYEWPVAFWVPLLRIAGHHLAGARAQGALLRDCPPAAGGRLLLYVAAQNALHPCAEEL